MMCSLKYHQRSGTHCVSLALWQSGGRVMSVIQTLPTHVLQGILALLRLVYRQGGGGKKKSPRQAKFQPSRGGDKCRG